MKKKSDITTYVFWIAIIFLLDPGGFITHYVSYVGQSAINFILTAIVYLCYGFKYHKNENKIIINKFLRSYMVIITIWTLYYFFWHYGINNDSYTGVIRSIIRNSRVLNKVLIVVPIVYFASISLDQFMKLLVWSSIIIIITFILSTFLNINLIPYMSGSRNIVSDATRYFMYGYGIIYLLLPLATSMILMKFPLDKRVITGGILVVVLIALSIMRRDIIGIIEYVIILSFLVNYIHKKHPFKFIKRFLNFKYLIYGTLLLIVIVVTMPKMIPATQTILEKTYYSVILGENTSAKSDASRMSLTTNIAILNTIKDNFWGGTGYDENWFKGDGGKKQWEGSDYIFLASFAMYGVIGLLLFVPFYFLTVKIIISFLKLMRENLELIYEYKNIFMFPVIIGLATAAEFIKNIIEYPNWFYPIGALTPSAKYFIYFGLLLGSYYFLQKKIYIIKMDEDED